MGSIHAAVWDITSKDNLPDGMTPSSVDIIILVFVFSALHPSEWASAVSNIYKVSADMRNLYFATFDGRIALPIVDAKTRRSRCNA